MAEGLARELWGDTHSIYSAGSSPTRVHPDAIRAMSALGIDISKQYSKSIDSLNQIHFDLVITLCAEEICPVFSKECQRLHWPLPDPADDSASPAEALERFVEVRNLIHDRLIVLFDPDPDPAR